MKGYKAFNENLQCRDMQYEIGGTYEHDGEIKVCHSGFHFCKTIADCYRFYSKSNGTRICEVEAIGKIKTDDNIKFCTDKITILSEVENPRDKTNTGTNNSGYCNSGNANSGNYNSGNFNSSNWNSGDRNSGDYNSGHWNSGDYNSGNCNSGDWNSGNWNNGIFNTIDNPKIKIFDEESDWTMEDWQCSEAHYWMSLYPMSPIRWVNFVEMTEDEKKSHPECEITGGFLKEIKVTNKDRQKWWNELEEGAKKAIRSLPNFSAEKFKKCTGINPDEEVTEE